MNIYTLLILCLLVGIYLIQTITDLLNIKNISNDIPKEFEGFFDKEKYTKSQEYLKANTNF